MLLPSSTWVDQKLYEILIIVVSFVRDSIRSLLGISNERLALAWRKAAPKAALCPSRPVLLMLHPLIPDSKLACKMGAHSSLAVINSAMVGLGVAGAAVGLEVGAAVGDVVGLDVGEVVKLNIGDVEGLSVGEVVGVVEGSVVGL